MELCEELENSAELFSGIPPLLSCQPPPALSPSLLPSLLPFTSPLSPLLSPPFFFPHLPSLSPSLFHFLSLTLSPLFPNCSSQLSVSSFHIKGTFSFLMSLVRVHTVHCTVHISGSLFFIGCFFNICLDFLFLSLSVLTRFGCLSQLSLS